MTRTWMIAGLLALVTAALWGAWLGWDHEYYDVDGVPQGPYRAWQVVGCVLTIGAAAVVAYLVARRGLVLLAFAGALGVAVPWSIDAAASDESGLWGVGLIMIVIGGTVALTVLLAVASAFAPSAPRVESGQ